MLATVFIMKMVVVLRVCRLAHSSVDGTYGLPSGPSIMPFASFLYPGLPAIS